jgi:aspartyl-tRNA(Asn)/glutamyl-tRNA(Gln) amidotransferase subunit B
VVSGGSVAFVLDGEQREVRLTRAHLEEDAGKSLHEDPRFRHSGAGSHGMTGIDLNRAGTPLLEIVSEPDMRSAAEAVAYAKALHSLVRWIGICDGNMQEGSFRCDANVSVRRPGEPLGTRCEIKNLNSFRFMEKAIEYEVRRQVELIEDGGKVVQETRLFDPDRGETRPMRSKEDAQDYRYFPDPDLLPLQVTTQWVEQVRGVMPSLPAERRARYVAQGVAPYDASLLTESREKADYFEAVAGEGVDAAIAARWVNGEVAAFLNERELDFANSPLQAAQLKRVLQLVREGVISGKIAKDVLPEIAGGNYAKVDDLIEARGLKQISDVGALEAAVDEVLAANAKQVEDYRAGKEKAFNSLVGQVMKATRGKANPAQVNEILRRKLGA